MPRRALDQRLNQRGRRSGVMIGLSMAAAMLLLVVGFSVVYTAIDPLVSDFVGDVEPELAARDNAAIAQRPNPTDVPGEEAGVTSQPTEDVQDDSGNSPILGNSTPTQSASAEPTGTPGDEFQPDYRVTQRINLRSGPGTSFDVVQVLGSGIDLQRIGDDGSPSDTPADARWLEFRTEDGDEGWIREIDVEESP